MSAAKTSNILIRSRLTATEFDDIQNSVTNQAGLISVIIYGSRPPDQPHRYREAPPPHGAAWSLIHLITAMNNLLRQRIVCIGLLVVIERLAAGIGRALDKHGAISKDWHIVEHVSMGGRSECLSTGPKTWEESMERRGGETADLDSSRRPYAIATPLDRPNE
ncbi:hypothetical protein BDV96DRAFT_641707 [Lophiotrema nucula]|uniref:Uncharacterized protein n=1 Tax=Lophiotrema nucula TaxID=690887 RepID=A0A6A5ZMY5_9PLEO|nr:hypothetical protein BDV96DRAFT_641707 [Lophiotrema nucula]